MASKTIVHMAMVYSVFAIAASTSHYQRVIRSELWNKTDPACLERNGRFLVLEQCDAYVECVNGTAKSKLCPEGLLFNPRAGFSYPCGYPIDVNCNGRPKRQPPKPTKDCPHQYGYFKVGDEKRCGQFMNCAEGRGHLFDCPEGLAFNSYSYRCDWPDLVPDCDAEAFLGFRCPKQIFNSGIQYYRKDNECRHYFACVNGRPRLQICAEGHSFNMETHTCEAMIPGTDCQGQLKAPPPVSHEVF